MPRAALLLSMPLLILTSACQIVAVSNTSGPVDGSTSDEDGPSSWPTLPESNDDSTSTGREMIVDDSTGETSTGEESSTSTGMDSSGAETTGDESTGSSSTGDSSTSTAAVDGCGDGELDPGEGCDNGEDNHDDNPCSSSCKLNLGGLCNEDSECTSEVCLGSGFEPDVKRCSIACDPKVGAAECFNLKATTSLCTFGGADQFYCTGFFAGFSGLDSFDDAQPPFTVQRMLFKEQQQVFLIPAQNYAVTVETTNQLPDLPEYSAPLMNVYTNSGALIAGDQPASMPVIVEPTGVNGFVWVVVSVENPQKISMFNFEVKEIE